MISRMQNWKRSHLWIFIGFYIAFAGLTLLVLQAGSASDRRENWIAAAVVGSVTGPFTGAIARHLQPCCVQFAWAVFPYSFAALSAGALCQVIPLPLKRFAQATRLSLWCVGLLGWFGGAVISFGHSLS